MSTSFFSISEHILPCQYIREYPHATKSERAPLRLAIKEYRPLDSIGVVPDSVTIIAAHANGLPKETYEPLFDDVYRALGGKITAIWIADCSHQGASGVLNEGIQGDDPNWFDHSRDLLCMVNHFRERMPRPIVGIAHSMGAAQLVHLSLLHPRLFHSLALIEPVIQRGPPAGPNAALLSSLRPDLWPSRSTAETSFRKNKFFKTWDARALDRFLQYGLRETPTALFPSIEAKSSPAAAVTLTTMKHQEAWSYVRSNFVPMSDDHQLRLVAPDLDAENKKYLFHRPEMVLTFQNLPNVRPNVLWMFGELSPINTSASQAEKLARTGTGIGGNGGTEAGNVEKHVVEKVGHMLPFENIQECASLLALWLERQMEDFKRVENLLRERDSGKSERDKMAVSKLWLKNLRLKPQEKRIDKPNL